MRYVLFLFTIFMCPAVALATPNDSPEFQEYLVQPGDTWSGLGLNEEMQILTMRVNRIDMLFANRTIMLPTDRAYGYVPVPKLYPGAIARTVIVFLREQYVAVYEDEQLVFWSAVSSGENGRTHIGSFQIRTRETIRYSRRYQNAEMPFAMQYSGHYFLHSGRLPGFPASHGCVRVLRVDAQRLFNLMELGDEVKIVAGM